MVRYYTLDEMKNPIPIDFSDLAKDGRSIPHVGDTHILRSRVSTVFLALDHRFGLGTGAPILFETMIFGGPFDQYQERCCTYAEAEAMHRRAVRRVLTSPRQWLWAATGIKVQLRGDAW